VSNTCCSIDRNPEEALHGTYLAGFTLSSQLLDLNSLAYLAGGERKKGFATMGTGVNSRLYFSLSH